MLKRLFDLILAAALLMALSPLLLIVCVLIRLDSAGDVVFRQVRVGRGCQPFEILKFRTMVSNAERLGSFRTEFSDPRITRVGRVLRRTSLDELPQLVNVLRGDMSLIGPRPDVPGQREDYSEVEWVARHRVRPGITGLAQATLRSDATIDERKRMDLSYAEKSGLVLDMRIVLLTIRQLLTRGGN